MFVLDPETLTPSQKGGIAEMASAAKAGQLGIGVLRPVVEGGRYDLMFDISSRLLRVQCKWAPLQGDTVHLPARTTRLTATSGYIRTTDDATGVHGDARHCPEPSRAATTPLRALGGTR